MRGFSCSRPTRWLALVLALTLAGCATTANSGGSATPTPSPVPTATPTPTPQPPCLALVPGSALGHAVSGVSGVQLPAGTYIGAAATSGGGTGQYTVKTYTLCFQGNESAIDGGILTPSATPSSTIGYLVHAGWKLNNLFPDPTNFAYLDGCSNAHICLNDGGTPSPFTFVGFDGYASHGGGYTTFALHVATIAAPTCLNDPQYYSGMPKYTLFQDGNSLTPSGNAVYHFQMPPGTRVSTFLGGGTAGSSYVYYCGAGTPATVVAFLAQAMGNVGYTLSNQTASGFEASIHTTYTYSIQVSVQNTNNYYLRIFVPM